MKKMISVLLIAVFSLFTMTTQARSARAEQATVTQSKINKAKFSGHWEYWCVYNEKTGEFEIIAVWVEDDM